MPGMSLMPFNLATLRVDSVDSIDSLLLIANVIGSFSVPPEVIMWWCVGDYSNLPSSKTSLLA